MIEYQRSAFGLGTLFRIQGSAVYRGMISGLFSVLVFYLVRSFWDSEELDSNDELQHPYAVGILVAALTFLLVFRAQAAYSRYWEACSSVHHMMSKWMDATTHTAIYHLQCDHYNGIKPPSFYDYPELNAHFLTRSREEKDDDSLSRADMEPSRIGERATVKSIERVPMDESSPGSDGVEHGHHLQPLAKRRLSKKLSCMSSGRESRRHSQQPIPLEGKARLDGGWGDLFRDGKATFFDKTNPEKLPDGFASTKGGRTPPLFLQELAHLCSLLNGVALSTMRSDIEGAEAPLDIYRPGQAWPEVDPSYLSDNAFELSAWDRFSTFVGFGRSAEARTRYNASRPIPIIGGVSEGEIKFLQMARGPYAKTQLCWQWLSEFIIREHLAGSTGDVGPPIISRIIQFLGDGMIHYNHCRKIMFIPFPFPHAQLSSFYILVATPAVAFLMDQYTVDAWVGAVLTFLTITALSGIHEVARELENPFRNVPNEIPLVTLQAQFNEALVTMYAGYHPDLYWKSCGDHYKKNPTLGSQNMNKQSSAVSDLDSVDEVGTPSTQVVGDSFPSTTPVTPIRANLTPNLDSVKDNESFAPSLEAQIEALVQKLEEQGHEIDRLRRRDHGIQEEIVEFESEKKVD